MGAARRLLRALAGRGAPPEELEARAAYERLAAVYPPVPHNELMRLDDAAIGALLPPLAGRRALDVGCGSGRWLRRLHEGGAALVVGCDFAAAMLARAAAESRGWTAPPLLRADVLALPLGPATFDVVVCALVLGHVADLRAAVAEIARVLAPGGVALWSDVHPAGTLAGWRRDFVDAEGRPLVVRQHLHLFEDHVAACRAAGLRFDDVREPRLDLNGDHPQRGWPALLAVRAHKPA